MVSASSWSRKTRSREEGVRATCAGIAVGGEENDLRP